jgi:primosomal protein N' (replication factor Y)
MIADVALPIPVGRSFSYRVPGELAPHIFELARVVVPFRHREAVGVVVALKDGEEEGLKSIAGVLDLFPLLSDELPALLRWSSSFYVTPAGIAFKHALPSAGDLERFLSVESADHPEVDGLPLRKAIGRLGRTGLLQLHRDGSLDLREALTGETFAPPPTAPPGSGGIEREKTLLIDSVEERLTYYKRVIPDHLERGGNVLVLVPDYHGAGAWFTKRLEEACGGPRVLWFSSGTPVKQRMETWFRVRREGGHVVLGNKNCVFLPLHDLSLIIVERCDDDEYKNEEGFKFNAVRVAVERARLKGASIVLGGAASSIDAIHLARANGFGITCNEWPARGGYAERMTSVSSRSTGEIIDHLGAEAGEAARQGTRAAVYTPRKDQGSYLKCHACRETLSCPDCGEALTYDSKAGSLACPACRTRLAYEGTCPQCGSSAIGFSRIGVHFIDEHLRGAWPDLSVTRITGDSLKKEIAAIRRQPQGTGGVLVGTQSLSKLYGLSVDRLLLAQWEELRKMGGYRSEERIHQILLNLLDALTPRSIISYSTRKEPADPRDYIDISSFAERELKKRREAQFPPFVRVFLLEARGKTAARADAILKKLRKVIADGGLEAALLGTLPLERPPYHIRRVILKGDEDLLRDTFEKLHDIPGVDIEADPVSF